MIFSIYQKPGDDLKRSDIPFEKLITKIDKLENIQSIFETIDDNPEGMKYLIDCQN